MRPIALPLALALAVTAAALPCNGSAQSRVQDPNATQSSRMEIVISAAPGGVPQRAASRIIAFLPDCRRLMSLDPADSAAIASAALPTLDLPAARRDSAVVFTLLHVAGESDTCDITGVTLRRGDREITPITVVRKAAPSLEPNGSAGPRVGLVSLAVDLTEVAPARDGVVTDLVLDVHTAAALEAKRFDIPWPELRHVWSSMLDSRDVPSDPAGRRIALASAGLASLARGDTIATRVHFGELIADDPCLEFAPSVAADAREVLAAIQRPAVRCTAQSTGTTILRSALRPGFGRPVATADRTARAIIAASVVASGATALYMGNRARVAQQDYLDFKALNVGGGMDVGEITEKLRSKARRERTLTNMFWSVAGATWGTQLVTTVHAERRHARRLEEVRRFDPAARPRAIGWAPVIGPSAIGFTVSASW